MIESYGVFQLLLVHMLAAPKKSGGDELQMLLWSGLMDGTSKQCLSGDLKSFPCLISEYSILRVCLRNGLWLQSNKASLLKGCGGRHMMLLFANLVPLPSSCLLVPWQLCIAWAVGGAGCRLLSSYMGCPQKLGRGCRSSAVLLRDCYF